jgi:hypothetical protein
LSGNRYIGRCSRKTAQFEGDDVGTFDAVVATVRLTNYAQIARKTIVLSNTEEVVNKAGTAF